MEEIKEILVGMQDQINGMQDQMNGMQNSIGALQQGQEEIKQEQSNMKNEMQQMNERLTQEVRAGNQRLAVFQEDITPKINILFDADATRKELLDIHDSEICNIKQEQFEHTLKINRLEQKVIGA